MRPGYAELFDRVPCPRRDRDFERIAEQPTETSRFSRLHDDAFKQFLRWISENIFQGTATERSKKFGLIRPRGPEDHICKCFFWIGSVAGADVIERIVKLFRPSLAAALIVFGICIELPTHPVSIWSSERSFRLVTMGFLDHLLKIAPQEYEASVIGKRTAPTVRYSAAGRTRAPRAGIRPPRTAAAAEVVYPLAGSAGMASRPSPDRRNGRSSTPPQNLNGRPPARTAQVPDRERSARALPKSA